MDFLSGRRSKLPSIKGIFLAVHQARTYVRPPCAQRVFSNNALPHWARALTKTLWCGNRIVYPAPKPKIIQALRQNLHQLALAAHIVKKEQKHKFENHHWVDRDIAIETVGRFHFWPAQRESPWQQPLAATGCPPEPACPN